MPEKIHHRALACLHGLWREQVALYHVAHNAGRSEIGRRNSQRDHGCLVGVYLAKFTRLNRFLRRVCQPLVQRPEIFLRHPLKVVARFHRFPLDQSRIVRMRGQKIEVPVHAAEEFIARRKFLGGRRQNSRPQLPQEILEHCAVQTALVSEVVVEHRLVRMRRRRDFLRPRSRQPLRCKLPLGSGQNSPRHRRVLHFSTSASHD